MTIEQFASDRIRLVGSVGDDADMSFRLFESPEPGILTGRYYLKNLRRRGVMEDIDGFHYRTQHPLAQWVLEKTRRGILPGRGRTGSLRSDQPDQLANCGLKNRKASASMFCAGFGVVGSRFDRYSGHCGGYFISVFPKRVIFQRRQASDFAPNLNLKPEA